MGGQVSSKGKRPIRSPYAKSQSAMEYLMTYGWAILIIAVILGVLFSLGVFNPVNYAPRVPAGNCHVFRPNGPGTSFNVALVGTCSGFLPQYVAQFNGQSSYITLSNPSNLPAGSITVTAWVYLSSPAQVYPTVYNSNPDSSTNGYSWIYVNSYGELQVEYATGSLDTDFVTNVSLAANQWYFVAAEFDLANSKGYSYINGVLHGSATLSSFVQTTRTNGYIGTYQGSQSTNYVFNGSIANVQIYNASLDANEISYLYNEGIGGAPIYLSYLVGWWPLNGDVKDYSGNGNGGTPTSIAFNGSWTTGYSQP